MPFLNLFHYFGSWDGAINASNQKLHKIVNFRCSYWLAKDATKTAQKVCPKLKYPHHARQSFVQLSLYILWGLMLWGILLGESLLWGYCYGVIDMGVIAMGILLWGIVMGFIAMVYCYGDFCHHRLPWSFAITEVNDF